MEKAREAQPKITSPVDVITDVEPEDVSDNSEWLHGNSKYDQRFNEQVYKLCLLGATDEELGDFFHVDVSTINRWKLAFPEFCESIKRGKIAADLFWQVLIYPLRHTVIPLW